MNKEVEVKYLIWKDTGDIKIEDIDIFIEPIIEKLKEKGFKLKGGYHLYDRS